MLFSKKNYQIMILGLIFIVIGFLLMSGGNSSDPNEFSYDIFSFQRIRLSPILIAIGFIIEIYAIMFNDKKTIK